MSACVVLGIQAAHTGAVDRIASLSDLEASTVQFEAARANAVAGVLAGWQFDTSWVATSVCKGPWISC